MVVDELRRTIGASLCVDLELLRWETHVRPDVGADAQAVINRQIRTYDIFVGIMWRRFGLPTKRAESGTVEEFDRALNLYKRYGRPKILFYFRTEPFYPATTAEVKQFAKILTFKRRLESSGVLYREALTPLEFERLVREHLTGHIYLRGLTRR